MLEIKNCEVFNLEGAIRGMRNAMNSWDRADSRPGYLTNEEDFIIGPNDMDLAKRLRTAGSPAHRKFLRQIFISMDITAPMYWWKEFDTYKIATVRNSTSTMHKLASTPITRDCFSFDNVGADMEPMKVDQGITIKGKHYDVKEFQLCYIGSQTVIDYQDKIIEICEDLRQHYNENHDIKIWRALIQLLPNAWNQTSTVTFNYENAGNMYFDRCFHPHKLTEWHTFGYELEKLPYAKEFIIPERGEE